MHLWKLGKSINKIFSHEKSFFTTEPSDIWAHGVLGQLIRKLTDLVLLHSFTFHLFFLVYPHPSPPTFQWNKVCFSVSNVDLILKLENNKSHGVLTKINNLHNIRDPKTFLFRLFPLHFFLTSQTRGRGHCPTTEIREQNFHPDFP